MIRIKVFLEEMIQRDPSLSAEMFGDVFGSETLKATILAVTSIPIALVYPSSSATSSRAPPSGPSSRNRDHQRRRSVCSSSLSSTDTSSRSSSVA